MEKKDLLVIVAVIFFIISSSLAFYVVPSMKRLPSNLNEIIYYNGKLGILNPEKVEMEYRDIEIIRKIKALREEGNVLIVREDIKVKDKKTDEEIEELCMTKIYGINPYTSENVEGYGDLDRIGQWIFPVGVKKKNYLVWNSDLDDACKKGYIEKEEATAWGVYIGEENRAGIKTYKFYGWQDNIFTGYLPLLPEAKLYYSGEITAWVEPNTGTIVDLQKHVWQYADFPDLHKLPSNLNISVYLIGNIKILNTSNAEYEIHNITLCNHIEVLNVSSNYYTVKNEIIAIDENGNKIDELCSSSIDSVNPKTMEFILSNKKGLLSFPVGVENKDYLLWNPDIKNVSLAKFKEEKEILGLKVYVYETKLKDYFIGNESIEGISDRNIKLYYTGNTTFFVEPSSGYIVYIEKNGNVKAIFPDLHTIPENFKGEIEMEGELWIASQGKKKIRMERKVNVENVYWENGKKILLIKDETNTYDKKTGEKIVCMTEYHGIYADTAEEAKNYGDREREGIYIFPPGVEKRDYIMWNPEINLPSVVRFIREEDHNGIHTYLFETSEDRIVLDELLGMKVRYVTKTKYWVEPNTGLIIDMHKESSKKINLLNAIFGIKGLFWIDVYKIIIDFSEETKEEMKEKAIQMSKLVKLSNSEIDALEISIKSKDLIDNIEKAKQQKKQIENLSNKKVKVLDLNYWMTEKSVYEMVEKSRKAAFLLLFMQIIIPSFLAIVGIIMIAIWLRR